MKIVECTGYGPPEVLKIKETFIPQPEEKEIQIKVHATTVSSGDIRIRKFDVPPLVWLPFRLVAGFKRPKSGLLGMDLAGEVTAVGKNVSRFKVGDRIFGSAYGSGSGAYAEYICISENAVLNTIPDKLEYEQAAPLFFGAHTALHFLRIGKIQSGQKVLIYGASGSIGTYAVQLARYFGADVTGICSTPNLELVKSLGADRVIDYTKEDFTENGIKYDIIFDTVGKSPFTGCVRSLKNNGYYLRAVHLDLISIIRGLWSGLFLGKKVVGGVAHETNQDLQLLKELLEKGKIKCIIDRIYTLDEIVEAHRYVEAGHKKGNVVITVGNNIKKD